MGGGVNSIQVFKESHLLKIPSRPYSNRHPCKFLIFAILYRAKKIQKNLVYKEFYYKMRQIDLLKQETNSNLTINDRTIGNAQLKLMRIKKIIIGISDRNLRG